MLVVLAITVSILLVVAAVVDSKFVKRIWKLRDLKQDRDPDPPV